MLEFIPFPKLSRLTRECVITEKLDGTNAQICILPRFTWEGPVDAGGAAGQGGEYLLFAGSRTRWIQPGNDNYGFAAWVQANAEELAKLGPGQHFGEWWGAGIQRRYGLTEKRFSLFNTSRWSPIPRMHENLPDPGPHMPGVIDAVSGNTINCCFVVPTLFRGDFCTLAVEMLLDDLGRTGSHAAPGFMKPEGIVVYHTAAKTFFKKTLGGDGAKGGVPQTKIDTGAAPVAE